MTKLSREISPIARGRLVNHAEMRRSDIQRLTKPCLIVIGQGLSKHFGNSTQDLPIFACLTRREHRAAAQLDAVRTYSWSV